MTVQIPHNAEAEESLIGACLIDGSIVRMVDIETDDFYIHRHRFIWAAMQTLASQDASPDIITLTEQLERDGKLREVGGPAAITKILANNISTMYSDDHATIIRDNAQRRRLLILAQNIAKAAQNSGVDIQNEMSKFIDELVSSARVTGGAAHWKIYLSELWDDIAERQANPQDTWGIPTGFPDFDHVTGGIQPGEVMLMAGDPGIGKSMLTIQMAEQMAHNAPGAIYSLEMKGTAVLRRILSAKTQIVTRKIKTGRIDAEDWTAITDAITILEKLPVYMSDAAGWTTTSLRADLSRLKIQYGIQWFAFDYLALMNDKTRHTEHEQIADYSRNMKQICRHLDLAGVIVHSMTKDGINAVVPKVTALRGEAGVSFDADVICFLTDFVAVTPEDGFIPKQDTENMRTLFFGKGRELENPRSHIHFVKQPRYPQLAEYAKVTSSVMEMEPNNVYRD